MKCINCNEEIAFDDNFCPYCGVKVMKQAPPPEAKNDSLHSNSTGEENANTTSTQSSNNSATYLNKVKGIFDVFWNGLDESNKTLYTKFIISVLLLLIAKGIQNNFLMLIACVMLLYDVTSLRKRKNKNTVEKAKENIPLIRLSHPINLRYKYVKQFLRSRKVVPTSLEEQKMLKATFLKIYPDNMFCDDLNEENSELSDGNAFVRSHTDCPINLRSMYKETSKGRRKEIKTSTAEQKRLKKAILMIYPDNMFLDDLYEVNSVKRTTNNNGQRDKDTSYDEVNYMPDEIIEEYFFNDNYNHDYDRNDTNCECEDACECDCEDACECESGDDCDCLD